MGSHRSPGTMLMVGCCFPATDLLNFLLKSKGSYASRAQSHTLNLETILLQLSSGSEHFFDQPEV